jgi:hypothetical protein
MQLDKLEGQHCRKRRKTQWQSRQKVDAVKVDVVN